MKITIDTSIIDETIIQEVKFLEEHDVIYSTLRYVCHTREEDIRKALIKLGWTPPISP